MTIEETDSVDHAEFGGEFYIKYEAKEILGRGLCSTVRRCVDRVTKKSYAVKIIDLTRRDSKQVDLAREAGYNEINLLKTCNKHPYIIKLHEAFETTAFLFLVFELCPKGELFDFLTKKVRLSEKKTRTIMKQLLEAVAYLHSQNIMHRDIKCENILFDEDMNVRLSDFGFSAIMDHKVCFKELLGTPGYLSPEMILASTGSNDKGYGLEIDMWACGVVMYSMISGTPPFYNRKQMKMLRDIVNGNYSFPSPDWDEVSDICKQLIKQMLTTVPSERISAKEALAHQFFVGKDQGGQLSIQRRFKVVLTGIRFIARLSNMTKTSKPLSLTSLTTHPYSYKPLRYLIDTAAFGIYGHWVKKTDEQNRAALFERSLKKHHNSELATKRRYRLLSGMEDS